MPNVHVRPFLDEVDSSRWLHRLDCDGAHLHHQEGWLFLTHLLGEVGLLSFLLPVVRSPMALDTAVAALVL